MNNLTDNAFVIFSGYNQRAVVAFCRQLRSMEIPFYIIALNKHDSILFSHYARNVKAIRAHTELERKEIIELLVKIKNETRLSMLTIAPSSEFLNHFLLEHRAALEELGCKIPLVDRKLYRLVTNKYSFLNLCKEHDIDIPGRVEIEKKPNFPFVAKPLVNITKEGKSLYPYIIEDAAAVEMFLEKERREDFYFEEFVCGGSYYLLLNISPSHSAKLFSQKNILQQADGKSIILAEPSDIHTHTDSLKITNMLREIGFTGLIMVEVRKRGNRLCVIEANPRLWGPLQLMEDNSEDILSEYIKDIFPLEKNVVPQRTKSRRKKYLWFNGLVEMIRNNKKVTSFAHSRSILLLALKNIMSDVYLRKDSFRMFFYEFAELVKR